MMPREELRRWLSDPRAQNATLDLFSEVSAELKALPFVRGLRESLEALPQPRAADVLACAERAMADEQGLADLFSHLIGAAATDPFFRPALRSLSSPIHSGILLVETPALLLFAAVMPADALAAKRLGRDGARSIVFPGHRSLYKFIRSGGATFSFWEAPQIEAGFTATASSRCRMVERRRIEDGELLEIDGRKHSFVIEHATGDLFYLQATVNVERAPVTVEYDSDTFELVGASSTDEISSRTQMMLAMLRTMDRADAVPVMIEMLDNPHFYARWQAMRELLALDAEAALPHLQAMAEGDPHPEVRATAGATLAACFPADAEARQPEFEVN
ncbi:MAG TPA: HEAT repeat domain-containing protein [Allosphingosinicella sp.]|jgi:hypothetical protein